MKRISYFNVTNLVKSFTLFFFCFTFLYAFSSYIAIHDVLISWPVFIINVVLSIALGLWYYRQRYHVVFIYDQHNYELYVGRKHTAHNWTDFVTVSLYHQGRGEFTIRLYQADDSFVEIPASALRINAREFRFEVMNLVKGLTKKPE